MWGSTDLQIVVGSAKPEGVSGIVVESGLLPLPADLTAISTVLHQKGRKRKRVKARLHVATIEEYYVFQEDAYGTSRTLKIEVTKTDGTYTIASVGEPDFEFWDHIYFDVSWVEV